MSPRNARSPAQPEKRPQPSPAQPSSAAAAPGRLETAVTRDAAPTGCGVAPPAAVFPGSFRSCEPDSAVLRAARGVLRDDDIASTESYEAGGTGCGGSRWLMLYEGRNIPLVCWLGTDGEGPSPSLCRYGDNLDCGVRIRADQVWGSSLSLSNKMNRTCLPSC